MKLKLFLATMCAAIGTALLWYHNVRASLPPIVSIETERGNRSSAENHSMGPSLQPAPPVSTGAPPTETAVGAKTVGSGPRRIEFPPSTLPPLNVPVVEIYDALSAQAKNGNYRAACRLSEEILRCEKAELSVAAYRNRIANLNRNDPGYAEQHSKLQQYIADAEVDIQRCKGFVNKEKVPAWKYLYQAAAAGHAPSMLSFVVSPPMNPNEFLANIEAWVIYREVAPTFLRRSADALYPPAIYALGVDYAGFPMGMPGINLTEPNPREAVKYIHLARKFEDYKNSRQLQIRLEIAEKQLTGQQIMEAKLEADAIAAKIPPSNFAPMTGFKEGLLKVDGAACLD